MNLPSIHTRDVIGNNTRDSYYDGTKSSIDGNKHKIVKLEDKHQNKVMHKQIYNTINNSPHTYLYRIKPNKRVDESI